LTVLYQVSLRANQIDIVLAGLSGMLEESPQAARELTGIGVGTANDGGGLAAE